MERLFAFNRKSDLEITSQAGNGGYIKYVKRKSLTYLFLLYERLPTSLPFSFNLPPPCFGYSYPIDLGPLYSIRTIDSIHTDNHFNTRKRICALFI